MTSVLLEITGRHLGLKLVADQACTDLAAAESQVRTGLTAGAE